VTVGAVPLLVGAYVLAWKLRSPRWTFVGDATLVLTAGISLFTFAFGMVSNFAQPWPAGLGTWRALHLAFGAASSALLVAFAVARVASRRVQRVTCVTCVTSGGRSAACALATAMCIGWTGWIGGEVLTYHAGLAVAGAAGGALAPELGRSPPRPTDLRGAMGDLRFAWASIDTQLAAMVVNKPSDGAYAAVEGYARHLGQVASWMGTGAAVRDPADEAQIRSHASALRGRAAELENAARGRDLEALEGAFADTTRVCLDCHDLLR